MDIVIPSLYVMSGIMAYATFHHLSTAMNAPRDPIQLLFGVICLASIPFLIFYAQMLQPAGLPGFIKDLRLNLASILLYMIFFSWFIAFYTDRKPLVFLWGVTLLFSIVFIANLILPFTIQYEQLDGIRLLKLPWGEMVVRGVGHAGIWIYPTITGVAMLFGFSLYALTNKFRTSRESVDLYMLLAVGLFAMTAIFGVLIRLSMINFIEPGPIAVIAMTLVMSVSLMSDTWKRLENSERSFRALFENSPVGIVAINPDNGKILQANQKALSMIGYSEEEILTKTVSDVTCAEDLEEAQQRYAQLANGLVDNIHYERRYLRKDGSSFLTESSVSTLKDTNDKVVRFIASSTDITERKRTENALRESQARLSSVIGQSPIGIVFGRDGVIFDANTAFLKMYGYNDVSEVQGHPVTDHIAPQCRADIEERIRRRIAGEPTDTSYETIGLRCDGSQFPLYVTAQRFILEDSPFTVAFEIDISERIQAEASLKESELRLRTIIEQSPVGISFSRDGMTIDVNTSLLQMFGYTDPAELKGTSVLNQIAPQCRDEVEKRIRLRSLGELADASYETTGLRKDGSQFPLYISVRNLVLNNERVNSAFLIDFTDRKKAETVLLESQQKLRELSGHLEDVREEERTRIAREIHDELGQELTVARIDLTRILSILHEPHERIAERVYKLIDILDRTANTARTISENLRPGMLDVLGLGAALEYHIAGFIETTNIPCTLLLDRMEFNLDRKVATVVFRIVQEALTNIARHAQAKSVNVQLSDMDQEILVIIQDDGKGMSNDSEKPKKHTFGLLGMNERVTLLGGHLLIKTAPGKGTRIEASIPRHPSNGVDS